jgi:hypothetical protein
MRDAIIGNASIKHVFRMGKNDSEFFDEETKYDNTTPTFFELEQFKYRVDSQVYQVYPLPDPLPVEGYARTLKRCIRKYARSTLTIDGELDRFFNSF